MINIQSHDAVTTKRTNVTLAGIPSQQVPPISVFLQEVRMQVVAGDGVRIIAEFGVTQADAVPFANGLEERRQMFRTTRVRCALNITNPACTPRATALARSSTI